MTMTRRLFLVALVAGIVGLTVPVRAQRLSYEQLTIAGTAVSITPATYANKRGCYIRIATAEVRYRPDGTAPTSTVGVPLQVGDVLPLPNIADIPFYSFIRTTSTSGVGEIVCWP